MIIMSSKTPSLIFCPPRCPPVMDLLLRCLAAYTSSAKTWLHEQSHVQSCVAAAHPDLLSSLSGFVSKQERDEACIALSATQESAIIQLLLEVCLSTPEDREVGSNWSGW